MEALKNMLFRLQTEAPPSEQDSNYVGAEADKENVPLDLHDLKVCHVKVKWPNQFLPRKKNIHMTHKNASSEFENQ